MKTLIKLITSNTAMAFYVFLAMSFWAGTIYTIAHFVIKYW